MRAARAPLLACVVIALAIIAVSGQDAIAQLYAESAHYYASDGAVEVRLDVTTSWVDTQGIRLVGANNGSFVTGAVFHSGNVISITLDGARGDFEGLEHPRYVVVRAGGINGTDGVYNAEDLRVAISYDDTAPPEVSSAEYDAGTGILSVSFSETVWRVDMGSVRVYGADGAGIAVAAGRHGPGDDAAYVDLEPGATPAKLYISAGGVADIWGNANSAELSGAVSVIATVSPPINGTVSPPINGTVSPPINGTVSPPINGTVSPPINGTVSPPINGTVSPPINGTVSPPINGTVSPPINATVSPPINGTVSPPINGTVSPPINGTVSPPINGTVSPPINGTVSPPINGTVSPPINGTVSPPINGTVSPPINGTVSPPINGTVSPPINGTVSPPINGTVSPPINGTVSPPINGTVSPPINGTVSPPINGTVSPPINGTVSPPINGTVSPPINGTVSPPINGTVSPPINGTVSPPINGTVSPPINGTVSPPINGTVSPPINGTVSPPINGTVSPPINGTVSPPINGTVSPPINGTVSPPINGTVSPPINGTVSPPINGTVSPPINGTVSPPINGTVSPPINGTVSPPINGTVSPPINGTVSPPINGTVSPPINGTVSPPINGTVSPPINGTVSPPINGTVSPPINGTVSPPINGTVSPPINGTVSPPINGTRDDTKPEFRSAVYYTDNGTISVQFSEAIQAVNGSRMDITDGDRAVSLDGAAEYGSAAVTTLELADRAALSGAASLNLTIQAGAVHDMHGNPIDAVRDVPVDIAWGAAELGFAAAASGGGEASFGAGDFVTTWKTTTASESITISVGGHAGTYTVDWGDGTTPTTKSGNATHTYASAGSYNVSISGDFERFQAGNQDNASKLIALVQWGNKTWDSMHSAFARANNMVYKATDTPNLADVTDMQYMFSDATSFNGDLSKWDVSKVTDMQYMFNGAPSFNGDLSKWDVSMVTDMGYMFRGATSFNGDLSKWDVSKVTAMEYMFSNAASFNGDLSKWDVSKVTTMGYMFHGNTSFNGNISAWDVSKVTNTAHMFTSSFFNGNISAWDVSKVINMWGMFENATSFNGNISKWDVSKVTAMGRMFKDATSFNGNISAWDVSKVTTMGRMFEGATAFSQNLGSWYMVLADHKIKHNLTVGSITPQNAYLSGHSPAYSLVDGAGDADNSLFEISGSALSIKQSPAKTTYSVRIGANADSLFGQNNAVPITLTYDGIIVNSATYATGNGTLIVSFSQPLNTTAHDASKIHIRDAGQSGGVALSNGIITDNGTSSITFDLNNADTSTVNAMATPQLDIGAGAVQNATGNTILAMSGLAVTINDTTRPAFSSASFSTGTGILTISFSEALNTTAHDTSKIHVRESGSNSGGVTFSNSLITVNGTSSITFDLNDTDTDKVNAMATPQLDIEAGAVSDTAGNQIAAIADQAITINDTIRPTFTSAAYATGSGELTITFSEPLDSAKHVATKLHIRESGNTTGGVTLSNGTITTNGTNSLTITLSNSNRTTVAGLTTPQLDIDAGAVSDTSGNQIASIADQAITINDTTKPTFSSAAYTTGSGQLAITFSEPLNSAKHVATKLHIRESGSNMGGVTLSNGTITTNGTNSLTITLSNSNRTTVAGLTTPQLDIDAGAVSDTAGNAISAISDQSITINDTTKPTFSSAAYTTGSGQLAITFSEPLDSAKHVPTKLHIRESGSNMGGVTLSNGTITTNGTNSLTITLSNSNRTAVAGLTTPQLDIDAGAVSDTAGNAISAISDQSITINDTTKPTFSSAAYTTGSGQLAITFSEPLDSAKHVATKLHIRESGQSAGGVTLSNGTITANGTNSLTITLSNSDRTTVAGLTTPQLDIDAGAVSDRAGNAISAISDRTVTVQDTIPPTLIYATYATGILTISFSEALDTTTHDASKIHIRNTNQSSGGVTLSNAMITATATDSITFTLNATHADRVNAMAAPELDIEQGAVRDVAGNFMSATHDNPVSTPAVSPPAILPPLLAFFIPESTPPLLVMNDDSIRPEMVSARVDVSEPTLLVTFDEHVTVSDWSGFALRSGPNALALAEPFNNGTRMVSAKIDGNLSGAITLDVAEGTVVDASGNANPPYGNLTLGSTPVMKSASYDNSTRILKITFDQSVMPGNLSRILLNGHAIGMSKPLGTLNGDTLYLALAETGLNASNNTVRVQTGAVLDGRGAPFKTNQTVPLHLPQSYTAPPQAVYSAVSGTMWLEMDGGNISLNGSAITVRNSTAQIRLSDAHVMLNGVARYSGNATLSPGGDAVLHMDIPAGAIRADSGTVPATGNLAVDVFGGINTTAISGFRAGNDTISVSLMQPGLAVVASLQGISVFDIMNASARAAFVPLNLTVLDMNPVPNTDHLAVLAPGAVLFLDLADPASPKWAGVLNFTDAASHGTVTPLIAEGVPYVVSVAEDTITQILASDPAKPKVVSSATISRGPPDGSGSTSPGFDKLYTSLLPETICVVDVVAPQYDARCMAHSGTPGSMDAVVSGGALYLVSATDAPGASIRAGTLEEVLSVRTGDAPADIGVVDAYGTAYVLVAADVLYAFDMSGDVIYKGVDGPYVSLDVAEFGGSTYAALLDTGDTIHVINLDGP